MPTCECGNEIKAKNSAGHWREYCKPCLEDIAEKRTPHFSMCASDGCSVCQSKLDELQSVFQPIYLRCLLERPERTENVTLDQYK